MNNKTLIWTLIVAVPVGLAALITGYIYRDTGRLPFQEAPATAVAPAASGEAAQSQSTAEAPVSNKDQTADAAPAAPSADRFSATFDVVGVEPTGETVVAGRSEAGAIVALTANGKVIGKSIANEAGEWTIILDEPLKPGDYDVGLEVHDENGAPIATSEQHVAVSLPEGGKEQPLIVLNTPEGPSDILQKPAGVQQVAEAAQAAPADAPNQAASSKAPAPETTVAATAEAPAADTAAPAATGEQQVASAPPAEAASNEETAAVSGEQAAATTASGQTDAPAAEASSSTAAPVVNAEAPAAAQQPSETATAEGPADQSATGTQTAADQSQPSAAPASTAETGTETALKTDAPAENPATAQSEAAAAATAAEGQESPATAAPVVTAEASSATPATQAPAATQEAAAQTASRAAPAAPSVTVEAVESEQDKVYVAGTGAPGSSVRVYVGDEFQGEAKVDAGGKWLVQGSKNIAEGNVEVRADLIGSDGNAVDARAAVTFEKEQDKQIVLTKVVATGEGAGAEGQGAEVNKALPVVIIRKGDNLWRISRRLYGHGVRFTTIYQANQDQIRNPDLIYPGQVFLTPEGDLNWKPLPENNG
ncbi:LysM peptidoglycan-binding domain-containing protein [Roseibium sp. M-1]